MKWLRSAIIFIAGFIAGMAFWYLASPLWIDRVVQETASAAQTSVLVSQGSFKDADSAHRGKGNVNLFKGESGDHLLRLTDFEVTNGPDLEVWLVAKKDISSSEDVKNSQWFSLGQLKGNIGDQNYSVPTDVNIADYSSVVIWCEQFGVLFASANLDKAS